LKILSVRLIERGAFIFRLARLLDADDGFAGFGIALTYCSSGRNFGSPSKVLAQRISFLRPQAGAGTLAKYEKYLKRLFDAASF
jgi:hypothetical protein